MRDVLFFFHAELLGAPINRGAVVGSPGDDLLMLRYPYEGRGRFPDITTGEVFISDPPGAPAGTRLIDVHVPPGHAIHFEITPKGHEVRLATSESPVLRYTRQVFMFGDGYRFSALRVADAPA